MVRCVRDKHRGGHTEHLHFLVADAFYRHSGSRSRCRNLHAPRLPLLHPAGSHLFLDGFCDPRSGGDYIWVSRFLNPTVGFMAAWAFWIASVAVVGIISFLEGSVVIPITLASFGYSFHMSSLVSLASTIASPADVFVIGMAMIIVASAIAASGPRSVSRTMILLFGLTTLGTLVCFYVLATSSHTDFVNALNGFGGTNRLTSAS